MGTATENLMHDHEYILKLTEVMLAMIKKENPDTEHVELALELVRKFADQFHHAKEEDLLFPLMEKKGFPVENGPVGVMLSEHEQGRTFIKEATDAVRLYKAGNTASKNDIFKNLEGYALLLQNHIYKENNILFRMADEAFSPSEQDELLQNFAVAEANAEAAFNFENAVKKIEFLEATYL